MKKNTLSIKNNIHDETFDLSPEELRQLGHQFTGIIAEYYDSIRSSSIVPSKNLKQLKQLLDEPLPQQGTDLESLIQECQEKI